MAHTSSMSGSRLHATKRPPTGEDAVSAAESDDDEPLVKRRGTKKAPANAPKKETMKHAAKLGDGTRIEKEEDGAELNESGTSSDDTIRAPYLMTIQILSRQKHGLPREHG